MFKHVAAGETWNMHPDQLMGEPYQPRMLLDAIAAKMAYEEYKAKTYRIL